MHTRRARILIVDNAERTVSHRLVPHLAHHDVEVARDPYDAIYRLDCQQDPHDVIFCDLTSPDLPGPELWAYLSIARKPAAERMVFVTCCRPTPPALAFLNRVPNLCIEVPSDPDALDALARRRAVRREPATSRGMDAA